MEIRTTDEFDEWLDKLKNSKDRIRQCDLAGKPVGDINTVGEGVSELRYHFGPGYRVYFAQKTNVLMMLFAGGAKRVQQLDIEHAHRMLDQL